jgi:peptidoglycan/LPS O-acetylase OafA/YrhL
MRANNMTALRLFAAFLVLYGHSFVFLGLPEPLFLSSWTLGPLGVYVFFTISGYLVAQSWERDPHIFRFLLRRSLRIFPGLFVCVLLSVFVLGPIISSLSVQQYFSHSATWGYLSNLYLYITYYLPGTFEGNRVANAVNGSLWSLPAEFAMYLLLALLGYVTRHRLLSLFVAIAFILLSWRWAAQTPEMLVVYRTDLRQVVMCGAYFWMGVVLCRFDVAKLFTLTNVLLLMTVWFCSTRWPVAQMLLSHITLPFLVLAFGLASSSWLAKLDNFDYSYGIYIYAFPVQQTIVKYWPQMSLYWYVLICTVITVFSAALSWYFVEKIALRWKPHKS